ncbi:MAG: gliding motility-associated ABC transporter permease subunit GldF [Tenuifilaceae bacterium]|jgi:ABC-2 type transport system permease protein|nr:gliding motility-associated ABC transporter permease subunit GldF [Tenuifilaceae bacterium]
MYAIFIKELNSFFSSLTGLIAAIVFLVVNGLFIWVFPGELNVFDGGYSTLDTLFIMAPWIFLFLVPAIAMRTFSEEKRTGTIELLLTRPISDMHLILGKYFAVVTLVIIILLPSLVFFLSVYFLGSPVGNIDTGGTWGSYIGLFFLAAGYAAISVFASSLTQNHIVSFIIGVILSFFIYIGLESIASVYLLKDVEHIIVSLGINEHYQSLSRGVIDSRDIVYFIGLSALFILATRLVLQSRKW